MTLNFNKNLISSKIKGMEVKRREDMTVHIQQGIYQFRMREANLR